MDYREKLYGAYAKTHVLPRTDLSPEALARRRKVYERHFAPFLPEDRGAAILDLGCGWGGLVRFLHELDYRNARGIDASQEQVGLAARMGIPGVEEAHALEHLRSNAGIYDLLFAVDLLEHLRKEEALELAEAAQAALKPRGRFVIHTVNAQGFAWANLFYGDLTHETAYTPWSLEQLFRAAGFSSVRFYPARPHFEGFRGLLRRGLWALAEQVLRTAYHAEDGSGLVRSDHILTPTLIAVGGK